MDVRISVRTLREVLDAMKPFGKIGVLPILNSVLIRASANTLTIMATNIDTFFTWDIADAKISKGGDSVVDLNKLSALLKGMGKKGEVRLECPSSEKTIVSHVGGVGGFLDTNISVPLGVLLNDYSVADFPLAPPSDSPYKESSQSVFSASSLLECIEKTQSFVSTDSTRLNLCGILFEDYLSDSIRVAASNGHALSVAHMKTTSPIQTPTIFGKFGIQLLKKLTKKESHIRLSIPSCDPDSDKGQPRPLFIGQSGWKLFIRPIDANFPDYKQAVPATWDGRLWVGRKPLMDALDRCNLVGRDPVRVTCTVNENLILQVEGEGSNCVVEVPILKQEGLPDSWEPFGLNGRYFMQAVRYASGSSVGIEFRSSLNPIKVVDSLDDGCFVVVMPMKLN